MRLRKHVGTITTALLLAVAGLLIMWDIVPALTPDLGDTESEIILRTAIQYKGVAWALGVIMGHLLWPMSPRWRQRPPLVYWSLFTILLVLVVVFVALPTIADVLFRYTVVAFVVGFPMGHFMWPQVSPEK